MIPTDFLKRIAKEHSVSNTELDVLSAALNGEAMNAISNRLGIRPEAARKRLGEVYKKFHIAGAGPGKLAKLQQILVSQYQTYQAQGGFAALQAAPAIESDTLDGPPTKFDWGEAPDVSVFYGRQGELEQLTNWIVTDRCRLVALLGIEGIGKTSLSVKLGHQLEETEEFEYVLWRSLRHGLSARDWLGRLLQSLTRKKLNFLPDDANERISLLVEFLRQHRSLLILDGLDAVLRQGDIAGQYREGYTEYGEFLRRLGQESHQSTVLLTSSEKPREVVMLEGSTLPVRSLQLSPLADAEAGEIFRSKGLQEPQLWSELSKHYRGNPLTLKIVSNTIQELFGGRVSEFLKQSTLVFGDIRELLQRQFDRLSDIEKGIVYWLAIERTPISLGQLRDRILTPLAQPELIEALESLGRRSLIERVQDETGALFTLQPVVMEFVTQEFVDRACEELKDLVKTQKIDRIDLFRSHVLLAESSGKREGSKTILDSVKSQLRKFLRNDRQIETQLEKSLSSLQTKFPLEIGYAADNVSALLNDIRSDIDGYGAAGA